MKTLLLIAFVVALISLSMAMMMLSKLILPKNVKNYN